MARYGWRPVFIGIGLVSLLWLPAWIRWMPRGRESPGSSAKNASFVDILRHRSFWGACAGHFSGNYVLYFMVTWLPFYLVRERHLSMQSMARTASIYYLVDAASAIATGLLSDVWIRRGYTPTLVRKTAMAIGYGIACVAMAGFAAGPHTYLPWLMAVGVGCGMAGSGIFAFTQTLAGPQAAGRWAGLQNGFANFAGVVAPALTGFVVDRTSSFAAPLAITAGVLMLGGVAWIFVVGRVEQVSWASKCESLTATASGTA
jgi:MFS transporter, ACS family, D-galactonate transporter